MLPNDFKRWDLIIGWSCFLIALLVYGLTVEPTVSYWDCGEYISTSAKLQVGHPPGAPFFQILGAFFALFAFNNPEMVALMVNYMSVFSSAFTILFVFWTITNLTRKLINSETDIKTNDDTAENNKISQPQAIAVLGSGAIGALAFTFSDSFWFNAVETEVYAMASMVMALLLWLGIKWADNLDSPRGDRWLILISFVIGLTFGIQFMGFLAIPSIGLLYFFKKYKKVTVKNFLVANLAVVAILLFVYKFSLTYTLKFFGGAELFFVNSFGLPYNSGTAIAGLIVAGIFYFALRYTRKKFLFKAHTVVLCLLFMFIGFSSWIMLPIRANAQVIINENAPTDARSLLAYYNREQYPGVESPIYGTMYSELFSGLDEDQPYKDDKPKYEKDLSTGTYVVVNKYKDALYNSNSKHIGLLPRMWSRENAENYMKYFGVLDFEILEDVVREEGYLDVNRLKMGAEKLKYDYYNGDISGEEYLEFLSGFKDYIEVKPPSLWQNLKFMFSYQFGYMYFRYFMWNFTGRQDDIQGKLDNHGNWISGFNFFDSWRLGVPQYNLPSDIKNNKARNTYYFLPLVLGLIGLLFQFKKNPSQFWVLFVFFMLTGLAIQFYTNVRPFEPRERDYSLVGSFYIFSLWIGLGVYALFDEFRKSLNPKILAPLCVGLTLLAVPTLMAFQNFDDHDRSGKYTARALATGYMDSVQEDAEAILFSIGDNDTFALWYIQEIEGYRTDVRVVNTSLFATDWYVDQMKQQAYESSPIPSQLTHKQYVWGTRDILRYHQRTEETWDIKKFMTWVSSDVPKTKMRHIMEEMADLYAKKEGYEIDLSQYPESELETVYYPTRDIRVPVHKENVLKSGLVKPEDAHLIVDSIDIKLPGGGLTKNRLLMLDILANNDWKRPIYFTGGSFDEAEYLWMKDYLQLDGLLYKLVPIKTEIDPDSPFDMGRIDSDLMYNIVMKWDWGNSGSSSIYHDRETRRSSVNYRTNLARLVEKLIEEEKFEKARKVIDMTMENLPLGYFGNYWSLEPYIKGYYQIGDTLKGRELLLNVAEKFKERLAYYAMMEPDVQDRFIREILTERESYQRLIEILDDYDSEDIAEKEYETLLRYTAAFPAVVEEFYRARDDVRDSLERDSTLKNADTSLVPVE